MQPNDQPAFPYVCDADFDYGTGMTLRDYFAAKALQGLMGRDWSHHKGNVDELMKVWAVSAYALADSMLKAREA
jgi:hypothetical protein